MSKQKNFEFGNCSDKGRVRRENEDYMGYFETLNGDVFLVCDGMGGHAGGAFAAQLAVTSVREFLERKYFDDPADAIKEALEYANKAIYDKAQNTPEFSGMGTTAVMLIVQAAKVWWGHVGDSRMYLQSFDGLRRLTNDHSFVQRLIDEGSITEEEALTHPRRNELLAALGVHADVAVDVYEHAYTTIQNDIILMCSDGLTNAASEAEIENILGAKASSQQKAVKLVEVANNNGGPDNITVQVVTFTNTPIQVANATTNTVVTPPAPDIKKKTNPEIDNKKTKPIAEQVEQKPEPKEDRKQSGFMKLVKSKNFQFWASAILFLIVMGSFALQLADIDFSDYNGEAVADTTKKPVKVDTLAAPQDTAKKPEVAVVPPPAQVAEPVVVESGGGDSTLVYTVKKGESVTGLADRFGVTKAGLLSGNGLGADAQLKEGQKIKVKVRGIYTVKSGDLLFNIAKKYNTNQDKIIKANPTLKGPADIKVGQKLYIL
ncbi:MAG: Stp1/IreP family PP2C-type Ser/Thr phosphatase [Sphingobacteriales bacterium JAD_PAG50586_3]|nr:MAG: Stp1/IreP family PP2C-type Ser/Thr phosphatase [Sphingobacteriales bacterium JAD_PAG50586_3]